MSRFNPPSFGVSPIRARRSRKPGNAPERAIDQFALFRKSRQQSRKSAPPTRHQILNELHPCLLRSGIHGRASSLRRGVGELARSIANGPSRQRGVENESENYVDPAIRKPVPLVGSRSVCGGGGAGAHSGMALSRSGKLRLIRAATTTGRLCGSGGERILRRATLEVTSRMCDHPLNNGCRKKPSNSLRRSKKMFLPLPRRSLKGSWNGRPSAVTSSSSRGGCVPRPPPTARVDDQRPSR